MQIQGLGKSGSNKFLYNGKEFEEDFDLGWSDYGARFYDSQIGRWNAVDNLAEIYYSATPYNYVLNQPTQAIDPDGNSCMGCGENGENITPPEGSHYIGESADVKGTPDDIYFRNGKEVKRDVNDKPNRYYELRENSDYSTGEEAVQVNNPYNNPSVLQSENNTGYIYTKNDLKVRNSLLDVGRSNVITHAMLESERAGQFAPVSGVEYRNQYIATYDTNKAFYMGAEEYFSPPGYGGFASGGRSAFARAANGLSKFAKEMKRINNLERPWFKVKMRSATIKGNMRINSAPKNRWNRFQQMNKGKFSNSTAASKAYNNMFKR